MNPLLYSFSFDSKWPPHFDAQLIPGPHVSHGSPDLSLVQGARTVCHNLFEVFDSPDLCLTDNPQAVVSRSLVSPTGWQRSSVLLEIRQCLTNLDRIMCCNTWGLSGI